MINVEYTKKFSAWFARQNNSDFEKIYNFVQHLEKYGFEGLPGRNKNSNEANSNKRDFLSKAEYANKFHLWHYHIGIPFYIKQNRYKKYEFGDYVSEFIIHYQLVDKNTVRIIKMDNHKPFSVPSETELKEKFLNLVQQTPLLKSLLHL